ncbi:hypothetical protein C8Q76DRAFT_802514 [Earliella scabrosa]|nr:hypothetical protein C8Q76DRAFT_802514 [Earliella scabrosa]
MSQPPPTRFVDRLKKPYHKLFGDHAMDTALETTITILENGREFVELAPIPGLPLAVDILIDILKKVQAKGVKSNDEAVRGLCEQVQNLYDTIEKVAATVKNRVNSIPHTSPDRTDVETKLRGTKDLGLVTRIDKLKRELDQVLSEAGTLSDRRWRVRILHSKRDTDVIESLRNKMDRAIQSFQFEGEVAIETVACQTLSVVTSEADQRILRDLHPLDGASYRSGDNAGKAHYLQTTRKNVFRALHVWAEDCSNAGAKHRVLVLVGAAGMGKSTIASEFCRRLDKSKRLGASFFFTRGPQGLNSVLPFFNTIAFQLATLQPDLLHDAIVSAAREHLLKGGGSQQQQLEYACEDLVRGPLGQLSESESESTPHSPIFVVVDALDECTAEDIDAVPTLLKLLLSCTEFPSSPLRILLTSRPEPDSVRHILDAHPSVLRRTFRDIGDQNTVDRDIEAVIHDRLSKDSTTRAWSDADPSIIKQLVRRSEGIFVYASTAAEFLIRQGKFGTPTLDRTLNRLLSDDSSAARISLPRLDQLYLTVLGTAFPEDTMSPDLREGIPLVLGFAAVWQDSQIQLGRLEVLTDISCEDSLSILLQLQAVVSWDSDKADPWFQFMHTTFRDFLLDPEKTKALPRPEFHVDAAQAHATLALGCMRHGLYYVEKYMPELLEESSEMLELRKLEHRDLRGRLEEKLWGKKVDEPRHSVYALCSYVVNYCAYHRGLSTSVQSAEMIETAERFDRIPTNVFHAFILEVGSVWESQGQH